MGLFDHLPPRPAGRRVAFWVAVVMLVRALLLTVYFVLGDLQEGDAGTVGIRLVNEYTGALTVLPLLLVVAWGASRWPLDAPEWRRHLLPLALLFVAFSATHTVLMETARWLLYPLVGESRAMGVGALALSIGHEMPNDLFYYALFVATIVLWRVWWRASERERREVELQRSLVEAQLTALRLQLQPHFLFNALNTISATMYDDPRRADTMLTELSELLRASLRAEKDGEVPLGEELAIAERYVRLQRERFGDRLEVTIDVPAECVPALVPVLSLQPLLENAVRHGRIEREGRGSVRVRALRRDGVLLLEVWDDGDGTSSPVAGTGLGLRATAERLRLLHGEAAEVTAGPADGGWRVRLTLPFRERP